MKKIQLIAQMMIVLLIIVISVKGQTFDENCTVDRFPYAKIYGQFKGAGFEIGLWPQDARVGFAAGFDFYSETVPYQKTYEDNVEYIKEMTVNTYTKGLLKINRFIYLTGTAGVSLNWNFYGAIGTRFSIPIGSGSRFGMIAEPEYGTRGFNMKAGIGIAL